MNNGILDINQRFICWPGKFDFKEKKIIFELQNQEDIFKFSACLFYEVQRRNGLGYENKFLVYQYIIQYIKTKTKHFPEKINFQYFYYCSSNFSWHKIYDQFFRELFVSYWEKETDEEMKLKVKDLFLET